MNDLVSQPINFLCVDLSYFRETFVSENNGSVELKDVSLHTWSNAPLSFLRFWICSGNSEKQPEKQPIVDFKTYILYFSVVFVLSVVSIYFF